MELIDLIFKIEELKELKRRGWILREIPNPESVSDHSFMASVLSFLLADESLDKDKCIKMALIHDLGESLIGDYTPFDDITDEEKYKKEEEAFKKLFGSGEILSLWYEFEENKTREANFVRTIDKLEMLIQAIKYHKKYPNKIHLHRFFDAVEKKLYYEKLKKIFYILKKKYIQENQV
ncbi:MAG: HD domain-containing protein [Candidatus Aenigmarchaeota archaeon]|nr:HD domain-containing protein [Candidatus Aenigmarchaeota archaeon]